METYFELDPNNHYKEQTGDYLLESCGFIPYWVNNWFQLALPYDLKEFLTKSYGFGNLSELKGGKITKKGNYKYPEDPLLYPLLKVSTPEGYFYQYPYGIVAIPLGYKKGHFVTRMD